MRQITNAPATGWVVKGGIRVVVAVGRVVAASYEVTKYAHFFFLPTRGEGGRRGARASCCVIKRALHFPVLPGICFLASVCS